MIDDIDRIMHVMVAAFDPQWGEAWSRRQILGSLSLPNTYYHIITKNGKIPKDDEQAIGFSLVRSAPGEEELLLLAICPQSRGLGLGKILLMNVIEDCRIRGAQKLFLEMREGNTAQYLYESFGFTQIGRRKEYYTSVINEKIDAITLALNL